MGGGDLLPAADLVDLARERGGSLRLSTDKAPADIPHRSSRTREGLFSCPRSATTLLDTDLLTPLAAYLRLRGAGAASFLLESVDQGRLGRYSLVGCGSRLVSLAEAERSGEPIVGHVGYDWIAELEPTVPLPERGLRPAGEPVRGRRDARCASTTSAASRRCSRGDPDAIAALLGAAASSPAGRRAGTAAARSSASPTGPPTRRQVGRCQEHIRAGDAFQIVLSQRARRPTSASALAIYRALRRINPSPYLFLLELGDYALVGSSPETHVKLEGTRASLNPIAGTTPAGDGDAEALLASEKDRAEHVMLVDLGRNDLSRVCLPGSVHVERFLQVERFSHVTHLVSEVAGEIAPGVDAFALLRATFPAGTVSGAPKVRAMQIISELEGYRRGFYAGLVGYHIPGVGLDTCIALRTMLLADGVAYLQAGGGLVADSDPAAEYQECLNKLAAIERAIDAAEAA